MIIISHQGGYVHMFVHMAWPFRAWKPRLKIKIKLIQIFFFLNMIFKEVKQFSQSHIILCQRTWDFVEAWVCIILSPPLRRRFRSLFPFVDNPNSNLDEKSCPFLNDFCLFRKICENDYWKYLYTFPKM